MGGCWAPSPAQEGKEVKGEKVRVSEGKEGV